LAARCNGRYPRNGIHQTLQTKPRQHVNCVMRGARGTSLCH
jgi:hypothetical protein